MAFTVETLVELVGAVREQMTRCPSCFGIGSVRQSGDYQPTFCLVCQDVAKAMYRIDRGWTPGYEPPLHLPKVYEHYEGLVERVLYEAREFAKRCPGCWGTQKVWIGSQIRRCLVCQRLHVALMSFAAATAPSQAPVLNDAIDHKGLNLKRETHE